MEQQSWQSGRLHKLFPSASKTTVDGLHVAGEEKIFWLLPLAQLRHKHPAFFSQVHDTGLSIFRFPAAERNRIVEQVGTGILNEAAKK